ncbi:MAG TPA: hypothetical protein P5140_07600 [Methanofastidiosum sp.]|nr:hypothetical protein [Methanofastidiosum sp.]
MKKALIYFSELNPPSILHQKVFQYISQITQVDILVYGTHTVDKWHHPLPYETKLSLCRTLFQKKFPRISFVTSEADSYEEILHELTTTYDSIMIAVPKNTPFSLEELLTKNGVPVGNTILYSFTNLQVVPLPIENPDNVLLHSARAPASLIHYVLTGDFASFKRYAPHTRKEDSIEYYDTLKHYLRVTESWQKHLFEISKEQAINAAKAGKTNSERNTTGNSSQKKAATAPKEPSDRDKPFALEERQFNELLKKYYKNIKPDSPQALEIYQLYRGLKKEIKDLPLELFFVIKSKDDQLSEQFKVEYKNRQNQAITFFRNLARTVPMDGGLSKLEALPSKKAWVLLIRSEPPTNMHFKVLSSFIQNTKADRVPIIGVIEAIDDKKNQYDAAIRTVWTKDLVLNPNLKSKGNSPYYVIYGTPAQLARTLSTYFTDVQWSAQDSLASKIKGTFEAAWNNQVANASQSSSSGTISSQSTQATSPENQKNPVPPQASTQVQTSNVITPQKRITYIVYPAAKAVDEPNAARDALTTLATSKKNMERTLAFYKAALQNPNIKIASYEQIVLGWRDAFLKNLGTGGPKGTNLQYREAVFYAFLVIYTLKTSKDVFSMKAIKNGLKALFASEIEAFRDLGSQVGATQIADAIGAAKKAVKEQ